MLELNVGIPSNLRGLESLEIVTQVSSDTFLVFTHTTLFLSITLSNNIWGKVIIFVHVVYCNLPCGNQEKNKIKPPLPETGKRRQKKLQ